MAENLLPLYENIDRILAGHTQLFLPMWEELPDIPLYMDQVTELMERYLSTAADRDPDLPNRDTSKFLTSSMVNNYVKMGIMPAPVRKKYSREHLAYLVMICVMKQSLSISVIGTFLQAQAESLGIESFYNLFVDTYRTAFAQYVNVLRASNNPDRTELLKDPKQFAILGIIASACANAGKLTCETSDQVLRLEKKKEEEEKEENSSSGHHTRKAERRKERHNNEEEG